MIIKHNSNHSNSATRLNVTYDDSGRTYNTIQTSGVYSVSRVHDRIVVKIDGWSDNDTGSAAIFSGSVENMRRIAAAILVHADLMDVEDQAQKNIRARMDQRKEIETLEAQLAEARKFRALGGAV